MICGNLTAQVTYNFGSSNGGANVTATDDKGFLLHYQVPNGRLAYQKYDSNAVFQYGFTQPANQIYTSTQRFGKVFCLLNSTHSDTIRLQKINMATGAVEINRRIGGPQYGTIGYFAYSPYHFVATQDSGLLVVLSKWQTYNAFFTDVSMVKFDKNLNVQFVRAGGWPTTQNILSRLVKQHSDGSIWHITSVGLVPGFGLNILRIDPQTGATLNQITVNNIGNPTTGGFAEVPGRVILSGITANEGYALSIAPDLSAVHWVKRYAVPLNFAGAYEFNTGPNNNLYGHLGDLVMCIRPADGSVVWSVNADAAANVVPRIRLGLYKMLALYSPGGTELKGALIDSLGVGLCNPVNYPVTVTTLTNTTTSFNLNLYATGGLTHFTLPNPTSTPVTASPTVACTAICNFTAGFTASANSLIASFAPLPFGLSSYYWTFGDGGTSNSMAPVHSYAASGTYTVCLIGTSGCMSDTVCQQVTVTCTSPTASFTTSGTSQTINFSNASTGSGPLTYAWAFGNGQTSTQTSPTHVYSSPGYYNACLIVNGPCGSDTTCTLVNAGCVTTVASFSATSNLLAAQFNNSSTSAGATTHSWDFGDGQMSTQASPSHVYAASGTYTVCLIVNSPCGADTTCQQVTITCPVPTAAFTFSSNLFTANFSNGSTGATSTFWDFGDGQTSNQISPSHTYAATGNYTVCLISNSTCGADTSCALITVTCPLPVSGFFVSTNQMTANFMNLSSGATSSFWDFGDGQSSTDLSPTHVYTMPGTYTACLIVNSQCGADTTCLQVTVDCPTLFAAMGNSGSFPTLQFNDLTIGSPNTWQWDFGDGASSTLQNPQHTYTNPATYTVCLTVNDSCSLDITCQAVDVLLGIGSVTAFSLDLYPNPAASTIILRWPQSLENAIVRVMTMDGRMVFETSTPQATLALNVSDWATGVYAVEVQTANQRVVRRLVVGR